MKDLVKVTLKELLQQEHSKPQCNKIIDYIGNDEMKFKVLMELFLADEYRDTQRAAWPLGWIGETHPEWYKPYFNQLLDMLLDESAHEAVKRNITRILQFTVAPKRYHGRLMDICFGFISSPVIPVASKASALTILENLASIYPEIIPELITIIQERWPHESVAYQSRARRILKKFERKKSK